MAWRWSWAGPRAGRRSCREAVSAATAVWMFRSSTAACSVVSTGGAAALRPAGLGRRRRASRSSVKRSAWARRVAATFANGTWLSTGWRRRRSRSMALETRGSAIGRRRKASAARHAVRQRSCKSRYGRSKGKPWSVPSAW
jgi:hypothetical protein